MARFKSRTDDSFYKGIAYALVGGLSIGIINFLPTRSPLPRPQNPSTLETSTDGIKNPLQGSFLDRSQYEGAVDEARIYDFDGDQRADIIAKPNGWVDYFTEDTRKLIDNSSFFRYDKGAKVMPENIRDLASKALIQDRELTKAVVTDRWNDYQNSTKEEKK
ncbi:MAG: hypothetical protein AABX10_04995 [Nanoarchaeota archaeon]